MYADSITQSMKDAIDETNRRRKIQKNYNKKYNIIPTTISKKISSIKENSDVLNMKHIVNNENLEQTIKDLTVEMKTAALELNFELAAKLRDEITDLSKDSKDLSKDLNEMQSFQNNN
jgi:excinuclease ABC subunit B